MTYRVLLQKLARNDLQSAYDTASARAPVEALKWLQRFERALQTLDERSDRCSLAREHRKVGIELREYLFGKRPYVFRALFVVDGDVVRMLRILRAQRRFLSAAEIRDALEDI